MGWRYVVATDVALARVIGVTGAAICKARQRGRIEPEGDGSWDVFRVVEDWRGATLSTLQRPAGVFRPWLSNDTPLSPCLRRELERRARAEGADVFWDDDEREQDEAL